MDSIKQSISIIFQTMARFSFLKCVFLHWYRKKSELYACIRHLFHHWQNDLKGGRVIWTQLQWIQSTVVRQTQWSWRQQEHEARTPLSQPQTESRAPSGTRSRHSLPGLPLVTEFCQLDSASQHFHRFSSQATSSGPSFLTHLETKRFAFKP